MVAKKKAEAVPAEVKDEAKSEKESTPKVDALGRKVVSGRDFLGRKIA